MNPQQVLEIGLLMTLSHDFALATQKSCTSIRWFVDDHIAAKAALMSDELVMQGFWKGWHASFNQWLVRYIYVPLGGSSMRLLSIWPIFTFVALWLACLQGLLHV